MSIEARNKTIRTCTSAEYRRVISDRQLAFFKTPEGMISRRAGADSLKEWYQTPEGVSDRCRKSKSLSISQQGSGNCNYNPNKVNFSLYKSRVEGYQRKQDLSSLENIDKPRTLCGVEGGWQLDHIIPIKYGFDNNIPPELIADISNLQMLPWKDNRTKSDKIDIRYRSIGKDTL